jgi:hypothetical protein
MREEMGGPMPAQQATENFRKPQHVVAQLGLIERFAKVQ